MSKRICVYCGKEFTPSHGNKKFCGDDCKRESKKRHYDPLICPYCGIEFTPIYPNQICCCMKHGDMFYKANKGNQLKREKRAIEKANKGPFFCRECAKEFVPIPHTHSPAYCCKKHKRRFEHRKRRLLEYGLKPSLYTREQIFERDQFTCHLCNQPLNMNARFPNLDYPTIDHVIPLSKGGSDALDNIKAAHFGCNVSKSDRILQ